MIHYEIAYKNLKDTSAHGTLFRQRMEEINRKHHRNITISKRMMDYAPRLDDPTETFLVLAIELNDGSHLLSSVARTAIAKLGKPDEKSVEDKQLQLVCYARPLLSLTSREYEPCVPTRYRQKNLLALLHK